MKEETIRDPFPLPDTYGSLEERIEAALTSPSRFLPQKPSWYYDGALGFCVFWEDVAHFGDWQNHYVTLYRAFDDRRLVGCRIEGIRKDEDGRLRIEHEDAGHPGWTQAEVEAAKAEHAKQPSVPA
jgi:hypothetical protein